ncbi:iron-containing redox enzyme family protein [Phenylobacterium sp. LH3H17]|uniref:iron-containing redox enzyme family protein n=1 Tax=Phenylobacterium sp. LH3H17 TaxID=2903901 RepID=UPI0020C97F02|nr:iron-containing redox enzyme family protein [Phenylobacterium sp. LH3H17]UTP38686.1 iron-containing redox enzyme family protein [Phenylobacterium sp. LH3H17]
MIGAPQIEEIGGHLAVRTGADPPPAWDLRIDAGEPGWDDDPARLRHAKHQALMRAYQARYMLLPDDAAGGSVLRRLRRHYDPVEMARLEVLRAGLEAELVAPMVEAARQAAVGRDLAAYATALLPELRERPEDAFTAWLRTNPNREHHYRNFLIQSSADLLAEASASALGVVGEFGAPQSALFRILIDEFGYGAHGRKHSVLYRAVMRGFGLSDTYNAYWPFFDTAALELHNTIHHLFQNPRNFFLQVGFLMFAETAYQRSTRDHARYLKEHHPDVDARYFAEHAHIDLHHTRMVIDEVALPLVETYGEEVGAEIVAGAELTRAAFSRAGAHMLAVSQAFDAAAAAGLAVYAPPDLAPLGQAISPGAAADLGEAARIQVGGLGLLLGGAAFAAFPTGALGRIAGAAT